LKSARIAESGLENLFGPMEQARETHPMAASRLFPRFAWRRFAGALIAAAFLAVSSSGCARLAASVSYNPLARVESSDGRWVYFVVMPDRRVYFGKNIVEHRLAQGEDFIIIEGVGNPIHRAWAQLVGFVEAVCFVPAFLLVQAERTIRIAFILPLGSWTAELTNLIIYPVDWVLHDIPVAFVRFLWFPSWDNGLRPRDARPYLVATLKYPAAPSAYVYFFWPWFQPGYVQRQPNEVDLSKMDEENLERRAAAANK
jgi:hypothetical protein